LFSWLLKRNVMKPFERSHAVVKDGSMLRKWRSHGGRVKTL